MIRFIHKAEKYSLQWGETWLDRPHPETYRDTQESNVRQIIEKIERGCPWEDAVKEAFEKSNPWLCKIVTSQNRDRFFREIVRPISSQILDIGAGWGQVALPLSRTNQVVALEPTPERLNFIEATARQMGRTGSLCFMQSNFLDVEFVDRFDLICCIGVLEWVPKFSEGNPLELQTRFLRKIKNALNPGGQAVVGIENRMGLKYMLGSNDDHIALPDISVYHRSIASQRYFAQTGKELRSFTYSLGEYLDLFKSSGFSSIEIYSAFPDYKIPEGFLKIDESYNSRINSGQFVLEHDGSCGEILGDDFQDKLASHYASLAGMNIAQFFAPSYFFVLKA